MANKPRQQNKDLTSQDIEEFRALLLQKRHEIIGNVTSMENDALRKEYTDLSHMPLHMGDVGSDAFETENCLSLVESERRLLLEIDEALARIENQSYGICLGTGQPIGMMRLLAIPWTKYSVEYARLLEQGLVHYDETDDDHRPDVSAA